MLNSQSPAPPPPAIVGVRWRPRSAAKAVPRPSGTRRQVPAQVLLQLRAGPPPSRLTIHLPGDALHRSPPRGQRQGRPGCRLGQRWARTPDWAPQWAAPAAEGLGEEQLGWRGAALTRCQPSTVALPQRLGPVQSAVKWVFRLDSGCGELIFG